MRVRGPNGAGKMATISMLLGLVRPTAVGSGCRERRLTRWRPTEARGMSYVHRLFVVAVYLIAAMTATAVTSSRRDVRA